MTTEDIFQAYYDARKHKRNSNSALSFEMDYESNLFALYDDIQNGRYSIGKSTCFISFKPVQREVFAADFRDRVVHHVIYNYIASVFERLFINDCYSCRVGRGTAYGIARVDHFIRSCSANYSRDCYILKLDIRGYFMSIDKQLLYGKLEKDIRRYSASINTDVDALLRLIRQTVFHDSTKHCQIRGGGVDWIGLPKSKSLFFAGKNKGLPIGNLTSQLFGNVYLNDFDHFVMHKLQCKQYGRYVDDLIIVHRDKEYLKALIPLLREYLKSNLFLEMHPKKIYLQHVSKGVSFLGTIIKPHRVYIGNRTKASCYQNIRYWNSILLRSAGRPGKEDIRLFIASMNSYLGVMKQYRTYKLRKKLLTEVLAPGWLKYIRVAPEYDMIQIMRSMVDFPSPRTGRGRG